jgi:hypothetical protein
MGLRQQKYVQETKSLILNLKALCFNKLDDVSKRFEKISKSATYNNESYIGFLKYFEETWINGHPFYPRLWNYSEGNKDFYLSYNCPMKHFKLNFDK